MLQNMSEELNCDECNNPLDNFDSFAFSRKENDTLTKTKLFCSIKCVNGSIEKSGNIPEGIIIQKISRCPTYYECENIGNLRKICEHQEDITNQWRKGLLAPVVSFLSNLSSNLVNPLKWCDPGTAGIIKMSDELKKANENVSENTKEICNISGEIVKSTNNVSLATNNVSLAVKDLSKENRKHSRNLIWLTIILVILTCISIGIIAYQIFF